MKKLIFLLLPLLFLLNCSESTAPENVFKISDEIVKPLSKKSNINKTSNLDFELLSPYHCAKLSSSTVTFTWEKFDEDYFGTIDVEFGRYYIEINGTLYPGSSNKNHNSYTKTLTNNKHYVWKVFAKYYKFGSNGWVEFLHEYQNSREFIVGNVPSKIYGWWAAEGNGRLIPFISFDTNPWLWPYHTEYHLYKSVNSSSYTYYQQEYDDAGFEDRPETKWDQQSPPKIVRYKVKSFPGGMWSNEITMLCQR